MGTMKRYVKAIRGPRGATKSRMFMARDSFRFPDEPSNAARADPYRVSMPPDDPLLVGVYRSIVDAKKLVDNLAFLQGSTEVYLFLGLAIYDLRVARKARTDLVDLANGLVAGPTASTRRRAKSSRVRRPRKRT